MKRVFDSVEEIIDMFDDVDLDGLLRDVENYYTSQTFIHTRLTEEECVKKDKFTPERLLGVETNKGFVTSVYEYEHNGGGFVFNLDEVGLYHPYAFRYYISDSSDETVSFDDYVSIFYEVEK